MFLIIFILLGIFSIPAFFILLFVRFWAIWQEKRVRAVVLTATPIDLERNRALNAAWAELMIIDPKFASQWRKRYPEHPNPTVRSRR